MKENNKLIAEFMGMSSNTRFLAMTVDAPYDDSWMVRNTPQGNEVIPIDALQYDSSWDWLMLVIKKCLIGQTEVSRGLTNTNVSEILDGLCYQDMSRTYNAVVEFIKDDNNGKDK